MMNAENYEKEQEQLKQELHHLQEQVDSILQRMESASEKQEQPCAPESTEPKEQCDTAAQTAPETPAPEPAPVAATASDIAALAEKIDTAAYQEGIIRDLHEELQRYKKGLLSDIAKGYVMDIIRIYEFLADTNAHFDPDAPDFDAHKVKHLLNNNLLSISDLLDDQYSIECYAPEPGSPYLPKEHKAMRTIETTDDSRVATVAECLACGFRYESDGKIVRQARVVVYKKSNEQ